MKKEQEEAEAPKQSEEAASEENKKDEPVPEPETPAIDGSKFSVTVTEEGSGEKLA